ncbi:cancer-related nucleoside-triphosphatase -like protein [Brachionus plicatilis]|uniref:Cancer-related nucleoside-triphosphatase-like protein n=1 Tax=Brachionus plicatilis TaxID=10195 RepID=A0A3M7S7G5_BRAPC|nr:cancer-related nucleoside-triphosphatase -like protein [Brachionus plicatilis]
MALNVNIPKIILITGDPGVGKTTLLKKLYDKLSVDTSESLKGFYTEELRDNSHIRTGFDVIDFKDNQRAPLARLCSAHNASFPKVGRYSVDLNNFEKIALPILKHIIPKTVYLVDEIGKMESYSKEFERLVSDMMLKINTDNFILVATVPNRSLSLSDKLKGHPLSKTFTVTFQNRNYIVEEIFNSIKKNFST